MNIAELISILPPPANPNCNHMSADEWGAIEKKIELTLPNSFKSYINVYGTGIVGDYICIFNPLSTNPKTNFFYNLEMIIRAERETGDLTLPLYPSNPGLVPFATTYDGHTLFWHTIGMSDNWPIVVKEVRSENTEEYQMNIVEFLIRILQKSEFSQFDKLTHSRLLKNYVDGNAPFQVLD